MFSINVVEDTTYNFGGYVEDRIDFTCVNFYYCLNSDKPRKFIKDNYWNICQISPKSRCFNMGQVI